MNKGNSSRDVSSVIITDELDRRPSRAPDYQAENEALTLLAEAMSSSPDAGLKCLVDMTVKLTRCDSAGISFLEPGGKQDTFRWVAVAGSWEAYRNGTMPREESPCGEIIAQKAVLLMKYPERVFPALLQAEPRIHEGLLAPFEIDGEPAGTVWAIKHSIDATFQAEDARLVRSLARFASVAHRMAASLQDARASGREAEMNYRDSEMRFRALATAGSSSIYRMSSDWRELRHLDGSDFLADTTEATGDWAETYIPPDERPRVRKTINRAIIAKDVFELEHRVLRANGTVGWTHSRAIPLLDDTGEISEWFGAATDVTERVNADQSFKRLFQASPAPFLVLKPDAPHFTIVEVNDAYLSATMQTRGEVVGRGIFEAFPSNPLSDAEGASDALRTSLEQVLATRQPDTLPGLKYDIQRSDGTFEERWWSHVNSAVLDDDGKVEALIHNANDVTEEHRAQVALRQSEEKYRTLFNSMDEAYAVVEVLRDEDGNWADFRFLDANPAFVKHTSMPYPVGKTSTELLGEPNPRWVQLYGEVLESGKALRVEESEETLGRTFDSNIFSLNRERNIVAVLFTDITERRSAQGRQQLLLAELQHRVRNILSMIRAVVRQSSDGYSDVEEYVAHLVGRLDAMARTQVLLTRSAGAQVLLDELVRDELESQLADGNYVTVRGPQVRLSPKAAEVLALALHELTTNSVKYGALSDPSGKLSVTWGEAPIDGQPWLQLTWDEACVQVEPQKIETGFGTDLIEHRVPYELRGEASLHVTGGGVRCEIAFPLADIASILETGSDRGENE